MDYTGQDIYCDLIIPGKLEVNVIEETDDFLVFSHTRPEYDVHIIVTPKLHISSILELKEKPGDYINDMVQTLVHTAQSVNEKHNAARIITNTGSYQDSRHLHWHVVSGKRLKL